MAKFCVLYLKREGDIITLKRNDCFGSSRQKAQEFLDGKNGHGKHIGEIWENKKPSNKELEELAKTLIPKYEKDFIALEKQEIFEKEKPEIVIENKPEDNTDKREKEALVAQTTTETNSSEQPQANNDNKATEKYYRDNTGKYLVYYNVKDCYTQILIEDLSIIEQLEKEGYVYIKKDSDTDDVVEVNKKLLKSYQNESKAKIALGLKEPEPKKESAPQKPVQTYIPPIKSENTYKGSQTSKFTPPSAPSRDFSTGKMEKDIENLQKELSFIRQDIRTLSNRISDGVRKTDVSNAVDAKLKDFGSGLKAYIEDIVTKTLSSAPDKDFIAKKLDRMTDTFAESLDNFGIDVQTSKASTEAIQGKVTSLENILSQKGVTISKENSPINDDAKAIANAKRLIDRLVEDIAGAAIEYGNKKEVIDNLAEKEIQHNQELLERTEQAKIEARQSVLIDLLDGYADIDSLLEKEENSIIAAFMKNNGLTRDEILYKDAEIEISEEECNSYLGKASGIENAGSYKVTHSAYHFGEKRYIRKAEVVKIEK